MQSRAIKPETTLQIMNTWWKTVTGKCGRTTHENYQRKCITVNFHWHFNLVLTHNIVIKTSWINLQKVGGDTKIVNTSLLLYQNNSLFFKTFNHVSTIFWWCDLLCMIQSDIAWTLSWLLLNSTSFCSISSELMFFPLSAILLANLRLQTQFVQMRYNAI